MSTAEIWWRFFRTITVWGAPWLRYQYSRAFARNSLCVFARGVATTWSRTTQKSTQFGTSSRVDDDDGHLIPATFQLTFFYDSHCLRCAEFNRYPNRRNGPKVVFTFAADSAANYRSSIGSSTLLSSNARGLAWAANRRLEFFRVIIVKTNFLISSPRRTCARAGETPHNTQLRKSIRKQIAWKLILFKTKKKTGEERTVKKCTIKLQGSAQGKIVCYGLLTYRDMTKHLKIVNTV